MCWRESGPGNEALGAVRRVAQLRTGRRGYPRVAASAVPGDLGREEVRDGLRDYVVDAFGNPDAILVVDETGDAKKRVHLLGVQRQYTVVNMFK